MTCRGLSNPGQPWTPPPEPPGGGGGAIVESRGGRVPPGPAGRMPRATQAPGARRCLRAAGNAGVRPCRCPRQDRLGCTVSSGSSPLLPLGLCGRRRGAWCSDLLPAACVSVSLKMRFGVSSKLCRTTQSTSKGTGVSGSPSTRGAQGTGALPLVFQRQAGPRGTGTPLPGAVTSKVPIPPCWFFLLPALTFCPSHLPPEVISQINRLHPSLCVRLWFQRTPN